MRQETMGFWDAVVSAGPYANNLHLAPDRQPHQHRNTIFYRPDALAGAHLHMVQLMPLHPKTPLSSLAFSKSRMIAPFC